MEAPHVDEALSELLALRERERCERDLAEAPSSDEGGDGVEEKDLEAKAGDDGLRDRRAGEVAKRGVRKLGIAAGVPEPASNLAIGEGVGVRFDGVGEAEGARGGGVVGEVGVRRRAEELSATRP